MKKKTITKKFDNKNKFKLICNFSKHIIKNTYVLDKNIAKIINENFMELLA